MKENCAICKHHDVFWEGSGCNLLNHMEECRFELKLKPCPFCGGKSRHKAAKFNKLGAYGDKKDDLKWHAIYCTACKLSQPARTYFSDEEAVEAWNRRVYNG